MRLGENFPISLSSHQSFLPPSLSDTPSRSPSLPRPLGEVGLAQEMRCHGGPGEGAHALARANTRTLAWLTGASARAPRGALVRARAEGEARTLRHRPFPKRAVGGGLQAGPEQETQPPVWDGPMGTRCQPKASTSVACHGAACAAWGPAGRFIRRAVRGPLQLHAGRSGIK
jgi:hypothetical protein